MRSDISLLRDENIALYNIIQSLEKLCTNMYDTCSKVITEQVEEIARERDRAEQLQIRVSSLEKRCAIQNSWNSRPSENKEFVESRDEFRNRAAAYEAEKKIKTEKNDSSKICTSELPVVRRNAGGQLGHEGKSRNDKCEKTMYFKVEMCLVCGRTYLGVVTVVRKRVFGRIDGKDHCYMYVMYHTECVCCGAVFIPQTDVIPGSAFLPKERATVRTYNAGGTSVRTSQWYLKDIESTSMSSGAISNCTTAMANELNGVIICMPDETPIVIDDDDDLRIWRYSVASLESVHDVCKKNGKKNDETNDDATDNHTNYNNGEDKDNEDTYSRNEILLTTRSTTWTSFVTQPMISRIIETASMDPYAETDETTEQVGKQNTQALVAVTNRTTQIKIVAHKYAPTLCAFLSWMKHRLNIRDGFTGYGWHVAEFIRCFVHLLRKVEDFAMSKGLDSDEYIRYTIVQEIYHEAKQAAAKIMMMAGGPMKSACDIDIVNRKGLTEVANALIATLRDKFDMASNMLDDDAATTMKNAADHVIIPIKYPDATQHTNNVEGTIRDFLVTAHRRSKGPFPNWKAAHNFSTLQTFAATCKKNGVSVYHATLQMSRDPDWDIFTSCIPPPIMTNKQRPTCDNIRP